MICRHTVQSLMQYCAYRVCIFVTGRSSEDSPTETAAKQGALPSPSAHLSPTPRIALARVQTNIECYSRIQERIGTCVQWWHRALQPLKMTSVIQSFPEAIASSENFAAFCPYLSLYLDITYTL